MYFLYGQACNSARLHFLYGTYLVKCLLYDTIYSITIEISLIEKQEEIGCKPLFAIIPMRNIV